MKRTIQKTGPLSCQKAVLSIFISLASMCAAAQIHPASSFSNQKTIIIPASFNQIEIQGNVTVFLTNDAKDELLVKGNLKDVGCVKPVIAGGKFIIDANRKKSLSKLYVYIPVKGVRSLTINGDTDIFSSETIKTDMLDIVLNGTTLVDIRYDGKVKIEAATGYELAYTEKQKK